MQEFTIKDLFQAYFDCRKNKRNTKSAIEFEFDLENNIMQLYHDLKTGDYKIGQSICFVVTKPKPREVWAACFRDRIVHHLIYNALKERFHKRLIYDTYSCIPKRGTLAAAKRLNSQVRSITNNYQKEAIYVKADISNFFGSINKTILFDLMKENVSEKWILKLLELIIFHNPKNNVLVKSSKKKFKLIPNEKSLWKKDNNIGLPIGNLTSQFFSNIYLNPLDQYIKKELKCKYYCRYVDDFVILQTDVRKIKIIMFKINQFLKTKLHQKIHPNKKTINKTHKGIDFVGYYIKPGRILQRKKTKNRILFQIKKWRTTPNNLSKEILHKFYLTINSYLGMMVNINEYNTRQEICFKVLNLFYSCDKCFTKIIINY